MDSREDGKGGEKRGEQIVFGVFGWVDFKGKTGRAWVFSL